MAAWTPSSTDETSMPAGGRSPLTRLCFSGPPEGFAALLQADGLLDCGQVPDAGEVMSRLTTYYDTPTGTLRAQGLLLECRQEAGRQQRRLTRMVDRQDLLASHELLAVSDWCNGSDLFNPAAFTDLTDFAAREALKDAAPLLHATHEVDATIWAGERRGTAGHLRYEVSLGEVTTAHRPSVRGGWLALELLAGDTSQLIDFARRLVRVSGGAVRPDCTICPYVGGAGETRGAASIGKAQKVDLSDMPTPGIALSRGMSVFTRRITALVERVVHDNDSAAGWQLRVALRRWRALERVYRRRLTDGALRDLSQSAQICSRLLGTARDWDVFLTRTIPEAARRAAKPGQGGAHLLQGFETLTQAGLHEQTKAFERAVQIISTPAFGHFLIDLVDAAAHPPWKDEDAPCESLSLHDFARDALEKRYNDALRVAGMIDPAYPETFHDLRLALKKLRYTAQLFRQLYPKEQRQPYFIAMAGLQDSLGQLNDALVAKRLTQLAVVAQSVDEPSGARGSNPSAEAAAAFICGYESARIDRAVVDIPDQWRSFAQRVPFWHDQAAACQAHGDGDEDTQMSIENEHMDKIG